MLFVFPFFFTEKHLHKSLQLNSQIYSGRGFRTSVPMLFFSYNTIIVLFILFQIYVDQR